MPATWNGRHGAGCTGHYPTVVEAAQRSIEPLGSAIRPNSTTATPTSMPWCWLASRTGQHSHGPANPHQEPAFPGLASSDTMLVTGQPGERVAITTLGELFGSVWP
ncbi:MAG: hypothetical protein R2857_11775 [Vampirovibrionales bacterium]